MARASTANATLQERMEREKEERAQRTTAATNKRGDVRTKVGGRRNYFTPKPKENVFQTALFLHETSKDPWDQLPGPDTPAVTTDVTLSQLRPGYDYFIRVGPGGPGSGTMTYRGKLREWRQGDPDIPDDDEAWWNADTGRWETIPDGCVRHLGPPEPSKRLLKKVGLPGAATADFNAVLSQMGLRLNDGVSEHGYQDQNMDGDEDHEMDGEDDDIEMETPGSDNNGDDEGDGEALNARRPDDEQEEEGGEERYHRRSHEDEEEEEEGVEQPRDQGEDEGVEQGHDDGEEETRAPFQREDEDETENSDYSEGVRERKAVNALRAKTGARPLDEDSADERHRDEEDLREMQMDVDANTGEGDRKVKGKGKGREVTEEREDSGFTALNIDDLLVMDNDDDDDDDDDDIEEESSATRRGPLNAAQKAAIKQAANTFRNLATEYRVSLPRIMREANLDVIHARGTSAWNAFQAWQRINGSRPSDPNEILEWSTGMRERYAATIAGKTKAEVKTLMETWVTEVKKVGGDSDVVNRLSVARKRLGCEYRVVWGRRSSHRSGSPF
ncbi:hypothetical protein FPV67DRAFT_276662 [Lyophyllum atratum]|nr:hypothetical protein FPV67DRAFT_276662 [Lyophyllum atratum]